jgi:hypothetical protein
MKIVKVVWVDSMILNDGRWTDSDTVDESLLSEDGMRHETAGFLAAENDFAVAVVGSRNAGSGEHQDTSLASVMVIPRGAIISITELKG